MMLFVFLLYLQLVSAQLPADQISAITRVYEILDNNTNGASSARNNVSKSSNPCSWRGVFCNFDNSTIKNLSFSMLSVSTSDFLPIICNLPDLESLDVSNNKLSSIPVEFFTSCGQISGLKLLNFSKNKLDFSLPNFTFRNLEFLDFSYNSLKGEIRSQFDGLDSLRRLNLSHNNLTGALPTSLGRLNFLEELQLSANYFTGEIPVEFTKYRNLSMIDFSINKLTGLIPQEFGLLTKLETLVLSINNLSGEIPTSIFNITTLSRFAANQNSFNGTIPSGVTSFLTTLDLSFNKLTGKIPSDLLSGANLMSVDLSYNQLEGEIPENISRKLFRLRLGSNYLNGPIPSGPIRDLVPLTYLELDNNSLVGEIPFEIGMCRNLALLNLAQNKFTGFLPSSLGNLLNLQVLNLQMNSFVGEIPVRITELSKLQKMNISRNSLNGSIPLSISNLTKLTNLDLHGNNLSGLIPDSIGSLSSLIELQLGDNHLMGRIPDMPSKLQIALNLSYNLFAGRIPDTLARLTGLEVLDLSNNNFSGEIPTSLTSMASLTQLVLSNNSLSGVFPSFPIYVKVEKEGNKGLIFPKPSTPPRASQRKRSIALYIIIALASALMAVGLLIMVAIFISRKFNRVVNDENLHSGEDQQLSPPRVVHGNLLTPNSIHKSNIDFKKAMEAVSDPLNITIRTRFSTYYKAVMPSGKSYFVKKLNWSDKIFQLGSHEKFGEELQVLGKLCNSNVMIPLAYVLTVDSAYLFYDFAPKGTLFDVLHHRMRENLDWASRYSIALGVSQGLAFLHECNSGQVLLLDLSSKSIMLKSLNEPQVGDIELFKVIDPSKSTGSLSTVAGSVGYVPPEYAYTMRVTAAGNVYSFGVVLLELLTGKPAVCGGLELAKWVLSNSKQRNKWDQILDFSVSKTSLSVRSQMLAVLKVALACVSISPETRPKMKSVLRMLLNAR